jgi:hypothetical protein
LNPAHDKTTTQFQLNYAPAPIPRQPRPFALMVIAIAGILAGIIIGVTTNAINGFVSPEYFIRVMHWQYVQNVTNLWQACIIQGVLEGAVVGLIFSAIFTTTIAIITKATCPLTFGLRWLGIIMLAIYVSWTIGGICGVAWAATNPSSFRIYFPPAPADYIETIKFAWVGGSIWGTEPGGLLVLIIALICFRFSWRRKLA